MPILETQPFCTRSFWTSDANWHRFVGWRLDNSPDNDSSEAAILRFSKAFGTSGRTQTFTTCIRDADIHLGIEKSRGWKWTAAPSSFWIQRGLKSSVARKDGFMDSTCVLLDRWFCWPFFPFSNTFYLKDAYIFWRSSTFFQPSAGSRLAHLAVRLASGCVGFKEILLPCPCGWRREDALTRF